MFVSCDIKTFSRKRTASLVRRHRVGWFNPSQWEAPMTEAAVSVSLNRETQRMLRHRSAMMTLARMRAKKAVLLALRAQGLKPQDFSAREIGVLTDYYVNQHRAKLMAEAAVAIATWPGFAKWRLPSANITTNAQKQSEPISTTSALQISGAK